jgi:hypothetical protein
MKTHPAAYFLIFAGMVIIIGMACSTAIPFFSKPTPTATETSSPTPSCTPSLTPSPTYTATKDLQATMAARNTMQMDAKIAKVKARFDKLGISIDTGYLGWYQEHLLSLLVNKPDEWNPQIIGDNLTASDFVISSDVTWGTTSLVECGLIFRAEPNLKYGKQYQFSYLRISGLPAWVITFSKEFTIQNAITGDVKFAQALNMENNSTNEIVMVVQGNRFDVYINDVYQGVYYDYNKQASEGQFAAYAAQDAGQSRCIFENTIIWVYK